MQVTGKTIFFVAGDNYNGLSDTSDDVGIEPDFVIGSDAAGNSGAGDVLSWASKQVIFNEMREAHKRHRRQKNPF